MFARTQRLMLRPGWMEDAAALSAALSDQEVTRNLATVPHPYTEADAIAYLTRAQDPLLPQFLIHSRTRGAPRLVGGCGLGLDDDGRVELGYWIARPYWGLGFATEAARSVMNIARATGVTGVRASHAIDNPASGKVLRKLGFCPTGEVRERWSAARGQSVPSIVFEQAEGPACDNDCDMMAMVADEQDRLIAA